MEIASEKSRAAERLADVLRGAAIGIAFIIPGFSGGSVAAILGIYEKLVSAVSGIGKHFAASMKTLLPILCGVVLGAAAFILPIRWGMERFPLATVSLFVGLALGGIRPLREKAGRLTPLRVLLFLCALLLSAMLVFLPTCSRPSGFLYRLDGGGYALLFFVGLAASCALVVPGISGSMLLLILGYYTPLVTLITDLFLHGTEPVASICVLLTLIAGMVVGFFVISVIMKQLLAHFPSATYFGILGFIFGSVVSVYAPFFGDFCGPDLLFAAAMLLSGALLSHLFVKYARGRS